MNVENIQGSLLEKITTSLVHMHIYMHAIIIQSFILLVENIDNSNNSLYMYNNYSQLRDWVRGNKI